MTPRQRDRRDRLIDATIALLETLDYENVQVKDVADLAGVSLGTLYNYFASKDRLFAEALARWADTLPTDLRDHPLKSGAPGDRLKEAVHRALRAFQKRPQMARLVNVLLMSGSALADELIARMDRATSEAYMQALTDVDPSRAQAILAIVNAVFSVSLREWSVGRISGDEMVNHLDSAISLLLP